MKIEIEFEEVEALKKTILSHESTIRELKKELRKLSKEELESAAYSLAEKLASKYISKIFQTLGFDKESWFNNAIDFGDNQISSLRSMELKDLDITIGANITEKFRKAFLRIGIKTL